MNLAEFQRCLMHGINPLGDPKQLQDARNMLSVISGPSADERLNVYRNNITSTRVRALQAIYPVCEMILGVDCFAGIAREYSWRTEDLCADLNSYAKTFPTFLNAQMHIPGFAELPYLQELAELEWHWHACHYTADDEPMDYEAFTLAAAHPALLYFKLASGLKLMQTVFPVREIWQGHRAQQQIASTPALETDERLCIHRRADEILVTEIEIGMHHLLTSVQQGNSLQQLGDAFGTVLPALLPLAIQNAWIIGFTRCPCREA